MAAKSAPHLNDRQREYLLAAYALDQSTEQQRKRNFTRGMVDRAPASEWRAMPYGRWQHLLGRPATPLRQAIAPERISPGTGSTWKALAERGLVEMSDRIVKLPGMLDRDSYILPHVSMTKAGRKLARELTGEVRESSPVPGVLAPSTWKALVKLWELSKEQETFNASNGNGSNHLGISWAVVERLEFIRPKTVLGRKNYEGLVEGLYYRLTTVGRIYYAQHWAANATAHPDIPAPDPAMTPELDQRIEQLCAQADELADTPPDTLFDDWLRGLKSPFPYDSIGINDYERRRQVELGIPETPAALAMRPVLLRSWRHFLRRRWLREHLAPAEWSCYLLWRVVQEEKSKLVWKNPLPSITVGYNKAEHDIQAFFSDNPTTSEVSAALSQFRGLTHQHQCGRWLLNFRGLLKPLQVTLRRRFVSDFITIGMQVYPSHGLRVALVAAKPDLEEWRKDLTDEANLWAFEWAAFSGEIMAREWFLQPNNR